MIRDQLQKPGNPSSKTLTDFQTRDQTAELTHLLCRSSDILSSHQIADNPALILDAAKRHQRFAGHRHGLW
jgi:hypothetical protein